MMMIDNFSDAAVWTQAWRSAHAKYAKQNASEHGNAHGANG